MTDKRHPHPVAWLLLTSFGCSTVGAPRPLSEATLAAVNAETQGRTATLVRAGLQPERVRAERVLEVGSGSTRWIESTGTRDLAPDTQPGEWLVPLEVERAAPTAALCEIQVRRPGRGAAFGLGLGVVAGILVGGVAAAVFCRDTEGWYNDPGFRRCDATGGVLLILAMAGSVGALAGTFIGRTTVVFQDSSGAPACQAALPRPAP